MAYTKAPLDDTYSVEQVSLIREINTRPGNLSTKDEDYLNCFCEIIRDKKLQDSRVQVTKRPGSANLVGPTTFSDVRGLYYWVDYGKIYYATGSNVIVYDTNTNTTVLLSGVFPTTTGPVGFCEFLFDSGSVFLIATDGTNMRTISPANAVLSIPDPDLPVHIPQPVFLDGYIFIAKKDTSDIYNCALNDPYTWDPSNILSAEIEGDKILALGKAANYLIAFGSKTIEFFWDAGNATGSPLQRNDTFVKNIGYLGGFTQYGNAIYFMGDDSQGSPSIFKCKDLKVDKVSSAAVERYFILSNLTYSDVYLSVVSMLGTDFLVCNAGSLTYVLDLDSGMWVRWGWQGNTNFPMKYAANIREANDYYASFCLTTTQDELFYFDDQLGQDDGVDFTARVVTDANAFSTMRRKIMHRLSIICDRPDNDAYISLYFSDDDYKTWSNPILININQDLPSANRLGSFRQRCFKLEYTGPSLMRLQSMEVEIDKGTS